MTFEEQSKATAQRFLQTAIVVDDGAYCGAVESVEAVIEPIDGGVTVEPPEAEDLDARDELPSRFDAEAVSSGFIKFGVYCSVLRPTLDIRVDSYLEALKGADLVVLDWKLLGDAEAGEQTLNVIRHLVDPESGGERFRTIAIYSGRTVLATVAEKLREAHPDFTASEFQFTRAHTRISLYAKEGLEEEGENGSRVVSEASLPARLVEDFASATGGLLSNVALEGMARIRENTHILLRRFPAELDCPYIAHRLLNTPPSDAEDHIVPVLADELAAILEEGQLDTLVDARAIEEYLKDRKSKGILRLAQLFADQEKAWTFLKAVVVTGLEGVDGSVEPEIQREFIKREAGQVSFRKDRYEKISTALSGEGTWNSAPDEQFTMLLGLRGNYDPAGPVLGPGMILQEVLPEDQSLFWISVQPACDSVRLKESRKFVFLSLTKAKPAGAFDIVVPLANEGNVRLKLNKKLYDGDLVSFSPSNGDHQVRGTKTEQGWQFVSDGRIFIFLASLKPDQTHRILQRAVGDLGRVGLTESEWARRQSPPS